MVVLREIAKWIIFFSLGAVVACIMGLMGYVFYQGFMVNGWGIRIVMVWIVVVLVSVGVLEWERLDKNCDAHGYRHISD